MDSVLSRVTIAQSFQHLENPQEPHKCEDKLADTTERAQETMKMWNAISSSRLNCSDERKDLFIIKVFVGGSNGLQRVQFEQALHRVVREYSGEKNPGFLQIQVEYIDNDTVSRKKWLPRDLINYLLESDLHFILTHIHQGLY